MTSKLRHLVVCCVICAAPFTTYASPVIGDVQVITVDDTTWIVRIRASEAQAFDVLPESPLGRVVIRLHGATLAPSRAPLDAAPFGGVTLESVDNGVDVHVQLAGSHYRATVVQGNSPTIVDVRITGLQ